MSQIKRIIDANANRAAEGIRVLEDIARFILADEFLASSLKKNRHTLRHNTLISSIYCRDIKKDVGTKISTPEERRRENIQDIAIAASNRCCEALRVLEECLKLDSRSEGVQNLRYEMYDLSSELLRRLGAITKQQWRLCFICTVSQCVLPWEQTVLRAISGGADCIQVREKTLSTPDLIEHVARMKTLVNGKASIIVNDRIDVMLTTGVAGVHLGSGDMPIDLARNLCGNEFIIGATVHSLEEAEIALKKGADYFGIGPIFNSYTKSIVPSGSEFFSQIEQSFPHVYHLAVGGIDAENCHELYAMNCKGIAVGNAIASSVVPKEVAIELTNGVPLSS